MKALEILYLVLLLITIHSTDITFTQDHKKSIPFVDFHISISDIMPDIYSITHDQIYHRSRFAVTNAPDQFVQHQEEMKTIENQEDQAIPGKTDFNNLKTQTQVQQKSLSKQINDKKKDLIHQKVVEKYENTNEKNEVHEIKVIQKLIELPQINDEKIIKKTKENGEPKIQLLKKPINNQSQNKQTKKLIKNNEDKTVRKQILIDTVNFVDIPIVSQFIELSDIQSYEAFRSEDLYPKLQNRFEIKRSKRVKRINHDDMDEQIIGTTRVKSNEVLQKQINKQINDIKKNIQKGQQNPKLGAKTSRDTKFLREELKRYEDELHRLENSNTNNEHIMVNNEREKVDKTNTKGEEKTSNNINQHDGKFSEEELKKIAIESQKTVKLRKVYFICLMLAVGFVIVYFIKFKKAETEDCVKSVSFWNQTASQPVPSVDLEEENLMND